MVSWHSMAWRRPGMNCSPAAEIHVKRADGESPHPLLDNGAANAGTAWFQGRNIHSGPVDFLESFFTTLVGQEKSEFQYLGWLPLENPYCTRTEYGGVSIHAILV